MSTPPGPTLSNYIMLASRAFEVPESASSPWTAGYLGVGRGFRAFRADAPVYYIIFVAPDTSSWGLAWHVKTHYAHTWEDAVTFFDTVDEHGYADFAGQEAMLNRTVWHTGLVVPRLTRTGGILHLPKGTT